MQCNVSLQSTSLHYGCHARYSGCICQIIPRTMMESKSRRTHYKNTFAPDWTDYLWPGTQNLRTFVFVTIQCDSVLCIRGMTVLQQHTDNTRQALCVCDLERQEKKYVWKLTNWSTETNEKRMPEIRKLRGEKTALNPTMWYNYHNCGPLSTGLVCLLLKRNVSAAGFFLRLQVEPNQTQLTVSPDRRQNPVSKYPQLL